ncbi:MAG: EamA family transporter RarD [Planctomycetota bacterium]|jgi:chloramphenicol-sensitive protein RarD
MTTQVDVRRETRIGVAYGLAAYLWWGMVPIYFKQVAHVLPTEVLAHRVIWSVVLLSVLMRIYDRWHVAYDLLRNKLTIITLCGTMILIAGNWLVFIWAVANDRVLQASLGYFINPLFSVLLGFVFLRERLRRWQIVSVALAGIGVAYLTLGYGQVPWVALFLAVSFGFYGLLRKTAKVDALVGLTAETTLLAPLALGYLIYLAIRGDCVFGTQSRWMDLLLALGGVITAVPLLWFTNAARRLRLATMGFLQYIAPSMHFLLAVAVYGEAFTLAHQITFACIWTALIIYSIDTARSSKAADARFV